MYCSGMALKSYGQVCALSAALDRIGSRWTMLILRDLLGGPARYVDLQRGLPGLASNLLTERLRSLEDQGLVERVDGPFDVTLYQLTETGQLVRPALDELGKLGMLLGHVTPPEAGPVTLRFFAHAMQALLADADTVTEGFELGLLLDGEWFTVAATEYGLAVGYERPAVGVPVVEASFEIVRDVLANGVDPARLLSEASVDPSESDVLERFVEVAASAVAARERVTATRKASAAGGRR